MDAAGSIEMHETKCEEASIMFRKATNSSWFLNVLPGHIRTFFASVTCDDDMRVQVPLPSYSHRRLTTEKIVVR